MYPLRIGLPGMVLLAILAFNGKLGWLNRRAKTEGYNVRNTSLLIGWWFTVYAIMGVIVYLAAYYDIPAACLLCLIPLGIMVYATRRISSSGWLKEK